MTVAFDLQWHRSCSDGALAPTAVMERASADGVQLVALTDHDTVDGVPEAREAARRLGVAFGPAGEISAVPGVHADLHVLGYEVDVSDEAFVDALAHYRADRQRRVE